MNLNKKQVKALLDVMGDDVYLQNLQQGFIASYHANPVLVITNRITFAMFLLPSDWKKHSGMVLTRDNLEKFYKEQSPRVADTLNYDNLETLLTQESPANPFPKIWADVIPSSEPVTVYSMSFDTKQMQTLETLAGETLRWHFFGRIDPMKAFDSEGNMYLLAPIKE